MFTEEILQYGQDTIKALADDDPNKAALTNALMSVYAVMQATHLQQEAFDAQQKHNAAIIAAIEAQTAIFERIAVALERQP